MKTCIISFSGRSGGNCAMIAEDICKLQKEKGECTVFDFSAITVTPCGRCEYECFHQRENCPHFNDPEYEICDTVTHSSLSYFIVPNYCDYPCANFFAFNERSQCYFQRQPELLEEYLAAKKKFIVVSNTERDNFAAVFRYHVSERTEPDILFLSAKMFRRVSIKGDLMDSPEVRAAVRAFI